ncbi:MAG: two-component system cell cycle response regulator [Alteromonadaceae bacterium]|jgi:two-component system cell cycle response regulator
MENIPTSHFMSTQDNDFSPLFGLAIGDNFNDQSAVSLVEQLQTTLEIDELLEIFSMEAAKVVRFCGLNLHFNQQTIAVRGSTPGEHRISFRLTLQNQTLAQLSYNLVEGLSKIAIRQLEKLHQQFLYPLRNALSFDKVKKLALKDALTGLNNRGHFDDSLNQAMSHAKRNRSTFALMMLDLDQFKQVNDNYGHQCGDEVIKAFATVLQRSVRGDDTVFRLGGDEFAVIAQSKEPCEASVVTTRIQHNVAKSPGMTKYGVSASIGFTFFNQDDSVSSLYTRSDSALYAAKDFGRNCTKMA